MRKLLFFLLLTFITQLSASNVNNKNLYRIQKNGLYGFIDSLGNVIIEPQYKYVSPFTRDGYACVISDIKITNDTRRHASIVQNEPDSIINVTYGYINKDNKMIIDTVNHISISFIEATFWGGDMMLNLVHKYINNSLEFRNRLLDELLLTNGLFIYQDNESKLFGYKDVNGNIKIKAKYKWCRNFNDGMAIVGYEEEQQLKYNYLDDINYLMNSTGAIDTSGNLIVSDYTVINDYLDGLTWAMTTSISLEENSIDKDWVQIDKKGNIQIGPLPRLAWVYNNNNYPICAIDMGFKTFYSFIDENGGFLSDFNNDKMLDMNFEDNTSELFSDVMMFSEGVTGLKGYNQKGESAWFFADEKLRQVSEPYDSISPFSEGLAAVKELTYFDDTMAHFGKWGFVKKDSFNKSFSQVIPFKFSECGSFSKGLAYFKNRGNTFDVEGFINKQGEIVWQTRKRKSLIK